MHWPAWLSRFETFLERRFLWCHLHLCAPARYPVNIYTYIYTYAYGDFLSVSDANPRARIASGLAVANCNCIPERSYFWVYAPRQVAGAHGLFALPLTANPCFELKYCEIKIVLIVQCFHFFFWSFSGSCSGCYCPSVGIINCFGLIMSNLSAYSVKRAHRNMSD